MAKPVTITVRLTAEQRQRLDAATKVGPYRIAITEVIARGIDLALAELTAMAAAGAGPPGGSA